MSQKSNVLLRPNLVAAVLGVSALGWTFLGHAQIEEIIVTAERRAEAVQDIGISVTALAGDDIRASHVVTPRDLFQRMPNVSVQSNSTESQLQLAIRGVSFATFSPIGVQPVIVFQDEVALSSPQVAGLFIFDSERIEVLRGPQNTLYGRNTTGGAVNFISRKPEIGGGTNGYADLTAGNFGLIDFNAAIGGELGERSAYRIAVQSLNNDGYWDNLNIPGDVMGERNQHLIRAQFAWDSSDTVSWLLNVHGGTSEGGQRPIKAHGLFAAGDPGGATCDDLNIDDYQTTCVDLFGGSTNGETDQAYSELRNDIDDIDTFGTSLRIDWDLDGFDLMSLTAIENNTYNHWEENDGLEDIPFVLFRQKADTDQFSQEFRLTSDDSANTQWIAGVYGLVDEVDFRTSIPILMLFTDTGKVNQETTMYSAFGQIDFDFSDQLTFIAGLRYVNEKKEGLANAYSALGIDVLDQEDPDQFLFETLEPFRAGPIEGGPFSETWDMWGGKLGIEYSASDQTLWYGHITRGEKSGQFTDAPDAILLGTFTTPAEPEEVIAYEAGVKATWANNTVQTNVAIFFNDYTNQHVQITVPTSGGGLASSVVNAAESEIMGLEFEGIFAPGNGWYIDLAVGLLDTEITDDTVRVITGGALEIEIGRKLTNAPEVTVNLGITKDFELAGGNMLTAHVDARYASEREFNLIDTADVRAFTTDPSYVLLNAFAEYRFGGDNQYKFSVWGKNLTDELYFNHIQEFGIGSTIGYASNPRQYGLTFGVDF